MGAVSAAAICLFATASFAAPLVLEGEVPEEGDFFTVPFEVPANTVELQVLHDDLSNNNILDFGLESPEGFRGWGGGNPEAIVVGSSASSRSYLTGPITPGQWKVVIGKAQIKERPAKYHLEISFSDQATLPPQPERRPYVEASALVSGARWYAGDFHVHSRESGDARPTFNELASFAESRGLDFIALSDHNTVSHLDFLTEEQAHHPKLLLVPSVEFTTYSGHANAFGATQYVDHRLGLNGVTIGTAMDAFKAQDAIFTINHPTLDIGSGCIGCAWTHPVDDRVGAIEVGVGGWDTTGALFDDAAIAFWDRLCDRGLHIVALGGSDDHRAGVNLNQTQSPIGDPTTLVFAESLSVSALKDGIRSGRTVVKLRGPSDPMIELTADGLTGDAVIGPSAKLEATITGAMGATLPWVRNGVPISEETISSDPFHAELTSTAPKSGSSRYRVEVLVGGRVRTLTSNLWHVQDSSQLYAPASDTRAAPKSGCNVAAGAPLAVALLFAVRLFRRRQ